MLLLCAATCPSVVARAAAVARGAIQRALSSFEASSAVTVVRGGRVVAGRCSVYRQVRYLSVRRDALGDMRAVSHLSVVQDLRDVTACSCVKQPLFGASFRKCVSQRGPHQARTRPFFLRNIHWTLAAICNMFEGPVTGNVKNTLPLLECHSKTEAAADVTQFDLTDFAGQKRDLRTMEPVAGEIGHCFVVGARHQLRASMSAGWRGSAGQVRRNFRQLSPQDNWKNFSQRTTSIFFPGKNPDLGAGLAGWRLRCRAGSAAGMWRARYRSLRCRAQVALVLLKCLGLETGTNHFLVAARVEFGTGNRHVPFFPSCPAWSSAWSSELETGMFHFFGVAPRGVPRGVPLNPGVTTGLKEAILG